MIELVAAIAAKFPPGLLLLLGALLIPLLKGRARAAYMLALPVVGLVMTWLIPAGTLITVEMFDYSLILTRVDKLSRIFGIIFHIAALLSVIYSLHIKDTVQQVAALMYAGSGVAAVFVGDLVSLFVFWEATAITSVFLIWARRTERAYATGMRYLLIQVGSGVLLLAGTIIHYRATGSLAFGTEAQPVGLFAFDDIADASPGIVLIFLSFGIKAAFPLLHNWLQDAYPEATITGTVWLSAFTTKLAIYALARGFAGTDLLIPIGAAMTAFPIFYAVIENDLRRVLAYSLNNQLGFMVVGIGIGTELALNGTAGHAFAHIIYKGLLFMSMGAVLLRAGTIKGSELGGLWRRMPYTTVFCVIGAAAISAFPLFSGFVTKSMILTAAAEGHHTIVFAVLLFASAGLFHHSKIPYFAFFAHDSGKKVEEAPTNMLIAMGAAAFLCVAIGIYPAPLYELLPFDMEKLGWTPYDMTHVVTMSQLLFSSALAFVFLQKTGLYPAELRSTNVDSEWIYRRGGKRLVLVLGHFVGGWYRIGRAAAGRALMQVVDRVGRLHSPATSLLGEPWAISEATLLVAAMLIAFLLLAFF